MANDSIAALPELGFVNLPRTMTLLTDVYHGATAARHRPRGWVDRPSEGILVTYGMIYQSVASGVLHKDGKLANALQGRADSVFKNTSFQSTPGF